VKAGATASSCASRTSRSSPRSSSTIAATAGLGVGLDLLVAAPQRADDGAHERPALVQRPPPDAQHELRIRGGAEVLDTELANLGPARPQRDALHVPERGRRVHAPGEKRPDGLEADRGRAHAVGIATVARDHRAQHGIVGRQPGDPGAAPGEVAGTAHLRLGEDRGERPLDEGHDADEVAPALARQPRSWMSRMARSARPDCSSLSGSVEAPGLRIRSRTPSASSYSRASVR
jgi:hypothetical protein